MASAPSPRLGTPAYQADGTPEYHPCARVRQIGRYSVTTVTTARTASRPEGSAGDNSGFRRRLLDGLAESIITRGYRSTTIAEIVSHARTSRRTFYEHFP